GGRVTGSQASIEPPSVGHGRRSGGDQRERRYRPPRGVSSLAVPSRRFAASGPELRDGDRGSARCSPTWIQAAHLPAEGERATLVASAAHAGTSSDDLRTGRVPFAEARRW